MSDRKQFLIVMLVAGLFVVWLGWRGATVIQINQQISSDAELQDYPYPFRVLRFEGDTAVMATLRSPRVSTREALQTLFPSLQSLSVNHREWQRAEREFARLQARASEIVLRQSRAGRIRWELDENWYYLNGMRLRYEPLDYSL
ncbi:hypothetical protein QQM79_13970 [Marinobacteraceae bacterium S3BR75-40.1]